MKFICNPHALMWRTVKRVALSCCLLAGLTASLPAASLKLFIWSEYIDPAVVASFEKEFNCKVTIDLYEDAESMLAKVQSGGLGLYDVVVPPDYIVPAMIKLKLLAPLRRENIPNLSNLDDRFLNPPFDRGNKYTAAYQWGTVGLLVRQRGARPIPRSWSVIFEPTNQIRPFLLIDSARDMLGAALKYRGQSFNTTEPSKLIAARDLVLAAKARCLGFDGSVGARNKVLSKTANAAIVYSGEGVRAMKEDPETLYFIPAEGSQIWMDSLVVLAGAFNRNLAEKFINFMLDAKIGARISNYTRYSSPNKAARAYIRPEDLKNPMIYPADETMAKLEFLIDLGANTRLYDEVWTQIKARP